MRDGAPVLTNLAALARDVDPDPKRRVSAMAAAFAPSEILKIAAEVRARRAQGAKVCDLTVGDFDPRHFPIPDRLLTALRAALERGETNYPVANGMPELRQAVVRFYARELGLEYPLDSVLIAGGSRPVIYAVYRTVCDPGDKVVYAVPSWNNHHYAKLVGAEGVPVLCGPEDRFLPTREALAHALRGARLLCLNSPLNPSGTALTPDALAGICDAVLEENEARARSGERPLFLLYDQVYWTLSFEDIPHPTPPGLRPETARHTVLVDGISKAFAATGLRVGWGVGPVDVMARMAMFLGHVGAWAPRAEQLATASLLEDEAAIRSYETGFKAAVLARLRRLHEGLQKIKAEGLPVDSVPPMGAIYLTGRLHPFGRRTPEGKTLRTSEDVRSYVLESAGLAAVPFQAFGSRDEDGWFRLSVGAVGLEDIEASLPRLATALRALA